MSDLRTVHVELGDRSYPIVIGSGMLASGFDLSPYLGGPDCLVVSNTTVGPLYLEQVRALLPGRKVQTLQLPDGEAHKTLHTAAAVVDALVQMGAGRDATVIALGGGVVGDIGGFAAAIYMRGIPFIQLPTTLLSQVDSSVGGKTGVNHPGGKNLLGAFHQPRLVLIDTDTLSTLPDRELSAGLAEMIKHGAIADDVYFASLEVSMDRLLARERRALADAIERSCEIKAAVVAEDEREIGKRALLNFGHTFAHAIENSLGYGEWLHGEAVAAGMQMAAQLGELGDSDCQRLRALTELAGLPVTPPRVGADKLRGAMKLDKKAAAGALRFVLLERIGSAYITDRIPAAKLDLILQQAEGRQPR